MSLGGSRSTCFGVKNLFLSLFPEGRKLSLLDEDARESGRLVTVIFSPLRSGPAPSILDPDAAEEGLDLYLSFLAFS